MKIELNNKSALEVASIARIQDDFPAGKTEMVEAIKWLYPIIKEHLPLDFFDWFNSQKNPKYYDVLYKLVECSKKISDQYKIEINVSDKSYEFYNTSNADKNNNHWVCSMFWLEDLYKNNEILFNVLVQFLALFKSHTSVAFQGESMHDDYFEELIEENFDELIDCIDFGDDNSERVYDNLLEENKSRKAFYDVYVEPFLSEEISVKTIEDFVNSAWPKSEIEQSIFHLMKLGLNVIYTGINIDQCNEAGIEQYAILNEEVAEKNEHGGWDFFDGYPVSEYDIYRFIWYSNAGYCEQISADINDRIGNFGFASYYAQFKIKSSNDIYEVMSYKDDKIEFLNRLELFMKEWINIERYYQNERF
jgi:hypothetical protein